MMKLKRIMIKNNFWLLLLLFKVSFSQTDTIYNSNGTFEHGQYTNGKKTGSWHLEGTDNYAFIKEYSDSFIYVSVYRDENVLKKTYRLKLTDSVEVVDGLAKFYDDTGNLNLEGRFTNGERTGKWIKYNLLQEKEEVWFYFPDSKITFHLFYKDGKVAEAGSGVAEEFNWLKFEKKSNTLNVERLYKRIGYWIEFHSNGRIKALGKYCGDYYFSPRYHYEENTVTSYVELIHYKEGTWFYWNKNAYLIRKEYYNKGQLYGIETY